MRVIIIGSGPTGVTLGAALARRGHQVAAIDRDPGPPHSGEWRRRGVMQFDHPHGFRPQVTDLLMAEWPEAWLAWLDLGAVPLQLPIPGRDVATGVRSRRSTYERALRRAATSVEGLAVRTGQVNGLVARAGRVTGVVIDGSEVEADLVVDAGGRLSRFAGPPERGGDTGMSYVTRTYRRRPGAALGPLHGPVAWYAALRGYDAYVFPHEAGHLSVVLVRPTADPALRILRHTAAFDAACAAIPGLATWTDPADSIPTSDVLLGGRLLNIYRPQVGRVGLVTVGDAVATTAPTAGRGLALASMQIAALLQLLDGRRDAASVHEEFGAWCDAWVRPWVDDHLAMDAASVRRWQGADIDLSLPLTSAAIAAAAPLDDRIAASARGYLAMTALPDSLRIAEPLARAVYETGWRPPVGEGPTRDELLALMQKALPIPSTADSCRR